MHAIDCGVPVKSIVGLIPAGDNQHPQRPCGALPSVKFSVDLEVIGDVVVGIKPVQERPVGARDGAFVAVRSQDEDGTATVGHRAH